MKSLIATCLLIAAWTASAPLQAAETRTLLVGVARYPNFEKSRHLSAPPNDLAQMRELLSLRGIRNVSVLSDDPEKFPGSALPTKSAIEEALAKLLKESNAGDFAVVYFSGHGSYQPDQTAGPDKDEDDGRDEVFLPYDAKISFTGGTASASIQNVIVDDELRKFAEAMRAKGTDLWFILDSCFSAPACGATTGLATRKSIPQSSEELSRHYTKKRKKKRKTALKSSSSSDLRRKPWAFIFTRRMPTSRRKRYHFRCRAPERKQFGDRLLRMRLLRHLSATHT